MLWVETKRAVQHDGQGKGSLAVRRKHLRQVQDSGRMSVPGRLQSFDEQRHRTRLHCRLAGRLIICSSYWGTR